MSDLLNMDRINRLPQPLIVHFCGGAEWPLYDIDVETGLLRIDVCNMPQVEHVGAVSFFRDACGVEHDVDQFYNEDPSIDA